MAKSPESQETTKKFLPSKNSVNIFSTGLFYSMFKLNVYGFF